jgi:hypothetical protein
VQPQSGVRVPYDIDKLVDQAALPVNDDIYKQQAAISAMHGSGVRIDMLLAAMPLREMPPLDVIEAAPFVVQPLNAVAAAAAAGQQTRAASANLAAMLATFPPAVLPDALPDAAAAAASAKMPAARGGGGGSGGACCGGTGGGPGTHC